MNNRPINVIAIEVLSNWYPVNFAALPYLRAMLSLRTIDDYYGLDNARTIINYFLANAQTWRGECARRIKAELKDLVNH